MVRDNFVEKVVKDPLFKKQLRLNELFGLEKAYNIHAAMTAQQILMWANSLLKPFCLQVKAGEKAYRLEPQLEVLDWIARRHKRGRIYKDSRNLLNQQVRKQVVEGEEDLFLDDEPGASVMPKTGICDEKPKAKKARARKPFDTSRLDVDINNDDE